MDNESVRKLTVGILLDSADGFMNRRILNNCIDAAELHDIQPIFFFGGLLTPGREPNAADFLYSLPNIESLSALIVFPHAIAPWDPIKETEKIIATKLNLPVYSAYERIPNVFSVTIDETSAIQSLVDHLVKDHSYRHFALLCGPDSHQSLSRKRRTIIETRLAEHGITIPPKLIFPGNFSEQDGKRAVELILKTEEKTPEVLISLNDQMATGAVEELLNCGIAVPADIAVTGFDDVEENALLPCLLSTIHVPVWEMITTLMSRIQSDISSKTSKKPRLHDEEVCLQAQFSQLESCGCTQSQQILPKEATGKEQDSGPFPKTERTRDIRFREELETVLEETLKDRNTEIFSSFLRKTTKIITRTGDLSSSFIDVFSAQWTITLLRHTDIEKQILANALFVDTFRLLVRTKMNATAKMHANDRGALKFSENTSLLLSRNLTMHDTLKGISENLSNLGIERCILIFTDSETHQTGSVRLSFKKRHFLKIPKENQPEFPVAKLINTEIHDIPSPLAVLPIALNYDIFGYLVFSFSENSFEEISLIRNLFSRLIAAAAANEALSSQLLYLEQTNTVLSRLSTIDESTGLYNRRVLHEKGQPMYLRTLEAGNSCCCIFLDMDGLKKINDEQGHPEGDIAIRTLAAILKRSFRDKDLLVRYGGDEFIVLMFDIKEPTVHAALKRVTHQLDRFNRSSRKIWQLKVSWGITFIPPQSTVLSFDELIKETDQRLYEEKNRRREAGLR